VRHQSAILIADPTYGHGQTAYYDDNYIDPAIIADSIKAESERQKKAKAESTTGNWLNGKIKI
jgi:hypothetical protein